MISQERAHELSKEILEALKEYELLLEPNEEITLEDIFTIVIQCVDGECSHYEARRLAQLISDLYN